MKNKQEEINKKKIEYDEICAKVRAQGEDKQLEVKKLVEEKKSEIQRKKKIQFLYTEKQITSNNKTVYAAQNAIEGYKNQIEQGKLSIENKEKSKA